MLKGFRDFIMRGNVVDLAVAVVIGAAFGPAITSFVNDVLMQIIAAIGGQPDFSSLSFKIGEGRGQVRLLPQRADHVPAHRRGGLLRRGPAHEQARRTARG